MKIHEIHVYLQTWGTWNLASLTWQTAGWMMTCSEASAPSLVAWSQVCRSSSRKPQRHLASSFESSPNCHWHLLRREHPIHLKIQKGGITSKTTFNNDQPRSGKEKGLWLETLWKKVNCLKGKSQYTGLLRKRHACTQRFRHFQSINVIQRTPLKGGTSEPSIIYYPCLNTPKIPFPTC